MMNTVTLQNACAVTMTVSASHVFGATKPATVVYSGLGPLPVAMGAAWAQKSVVSIPVHRPVSTRRAALLKTPAGQAMEQKALKDMGAALSAHSMAPIVALRMKQGLTQKALCDKTGLPQPHVSRLENGRVPNPDLATLQSLSAALGVGLDELVATLQQGKAR